MLLGATSFLRELCMMDHDVRWMYILYTDKITKKKFKPLILLLQSAYMVQIYVLKGKSSCKLLQSHDCIDIRERKLKRQLWDSCVESL